jgi:hypothetical protein
MCEELTSLVSALFSSRVSPVCVAVCVAVCLGEGAGALLHCSASSSARRRLPRSRDA